jgi:hypothetical protein
MWLACVRGVPDVCNTGRAGIALVTYSSLGAVRRSAAKGARSDSGCRTVRSNRARGLSILRCLIQETECPLNPSR